MRVWEAWGAGLLGTWMYRIRAHPRLTRGARRPRRAAALLSLAVVPLRLLLQALLPL